MASRPPRVPRVGSADTPLSSSTGFSYMRRLIVVGYATSEAARIVGAQGGPSRDSDQLVGIENLLINGCLGVTTAVGGAGLRAAIEALVKEGHGAIAIGGPAAQEVEPPASVTLLPPQLDQRRPCS